MGLISRVSSRTYRLLSSENNLKKTTIKWLSLTNSSPAQTKATKSPKPLVIKTTKSRLKGRNTKKAQHVRKVIREVAGYSAYEKRCIELLKISKDKRAMKFCKKRLGSHSAAKRKRDEMNNHIQEEKRARKH